MIDLHAHLLHGVDDGAASLDDSLELARAAVADGIRLSVLTPHVHPGRYRNTLSSLQSRFQDLRDALSDAGIPLEIRLAGEVRLGIESLELLLENEVPFLGEVDGYKVMLLEFPHQMIPVGSKQFVDKLLQMKIRPLIAHPERNKSIMAQPNQLLPFLESGCWLQLTAASLAGRFGESALSCARTLLKNGWAYVIATDAHNLEHRPPHLKAGRDAAAGIVGEAMAEQMVSQRPARILGVA